MFEALKVKYCLVFTTVNFISVSWGPAPCCCCCYGINRTKASSFSLAWIVFVRHEVKHKTSRVGESGRLYAVSIKITVSMKFILSTVLWASKENPHFTEKGTYMLVYCTAVFLSLC
jgi:hypothetical protein